MSQAPSFTGTARPPRPLISAEFAEQLAHFAYHRAAARKQLADGRDATEPVRAMWHALNHLVHHGRRRKPLQPVLDMLSDEYDALLREHVARQVPAQTAAGGRS